MARGYNTATQFTGRLGSYMFDVGYVPSGDVSSALGSADVSETHMIPTRLTHVVVGYLYSQCDSGDGYIGCLTGSGRVADCTGTASTPDSTAYPSLCFTLDTSCSGAGGDYYFAIGW